MQLLGRSVEFSLVAGSHMQHGRLPAFRCVFKSYSVMEVGRWGRWDLLIGSAAGNSQKAVAVHECFLSDFMLTTEYFTSSLINLL